MSYKDSEELLPDMQELGMIMTALRSLYPRAYDPELDEYILSFEEVPGMPVSASRTH